jgi:hypothetical protein
MDCAAPKGTARGGVCCAARLRREREEEEEREIEMRLFA